MAGEELDAETLKDILSSVLSDFAPRMGSSWLSIGNKLRQRNLVSELQSSSEMGRQKVQRIINAWLETAYEDVPVCAETVSRVLRSPAVTLGAVANDFEKKFAKELKMRAEEHRKKVEKQKEASKLAAQHPASHPPPELPPTGAHPPAGAPTGNFESATSDVDRRPPPFGVSQGPSQSSNSQDPDSLLLPQGLIDIHPLEKDGGDPREGAESPVLESVEEHGQPTQGDVQRGSGNVGEVERDGPVATADVLKATTKHTTGTGDRGAGEASHDQQVDEVAMVESVGQRCVPFLELLKAAAAVCRIRWTTASHHATRTYYGSGCFVADDQQFFLLTCCHNFLTREDGKKLLWRTDELEESEAKELKEKLTANCKAAVYDISDKTTFKTDHKTASDVLLDYENPHLYIVQDKDLLVIKVNNPTNYGVSEPIPLQPDVNREEDLLPGAQVFSLVQFPFQKDKAARPLEISIGVKYYDPDQAAIQNVVKYELDAWEGSSGSPLLYNGDNGIVVMAVHRTGATRDQIPKYNVGSVLTQTFLSGLRGALYN